MTKDSVVKIGDLGVSKIIASTIHAQSLAGTRNYMSPEQLSNEKYTEKTDVWFVLMPILNLYFLIFIMFFKTCFFAVLNKSKLKRSLGCVLYEMMNLKKAFTKEQTYIVSEMTIPPLGNHFLFSPILEKFVVVYF